MGSLVLGHQHEWFGLVASAFEPFDRQVRHQVRHITGVAFPAAVHLDQVRIVVTALARQNFPVIKPGGLACQVPLTDQRGLVSGLLQGLGKGPL